MKETKGTDVFNSIDDLITVITREGPIIESIATQEQNTELININKRLLKQMLEFVKSIPPRKAWENIVFTEEG